MAQAPSPFRRRPPGLRRAGTHCLALLVCAVVGALACAPLDARAQLAPGLLIQGPSKGSSTRLALGERLELRLRGEDEFWTGTLAELYPEANALRVNDLLLALDDVAALRIERRGAGLRRILRIQGLVNLGVIGLAAAFDSEVREQQRGFAIGAAAVNAGMVVSGSIFQRVTRELGPGQRHRLVIVDVGYAVPQAPEQPRRY